MYSENKLQFARLPFILGFFGDFFIFFVPESTGVNLNILTVPVHASASVLFLPPDSQTLPNPAVLSCTYTLK